MFKRLAMITLDLFLCLIVDDMDLNATCISTMR